MEKRYTRRSGILGYSHGVERAKDMEKQYTRIFTWC